MCECLVRSAYEIVVISVFNGVIIRMSATSIFRM